MEHLSKAEIETAYAERIARTRAALEALLKPEELAQIGQRTGSRVMVGGEGVKIEDVARAAATKCEAAGNEFMAGRIDEARADYIAAVNDFWLYAENTGITGRLKRAFVSKYRRTLKAAGIEASDVDAEATFAMREQCVRYRPDRGASLSTYAKRGIFDALNVLLGRYATPVSVGTRTAREHRDLFNRASLDGL
jgi:hypothetical protein